MKVIFHQYLKLSENIPKQAETEVVPSSSLVEVEVWVEIRVEVGGEVEAGAGGIGVGLGLHFWSGGSGWSQVI